MWILKNNFYVQKIYIWTSVNQALGQNYLNGRDYIVKDNEIIIIDEQTGRQLLEFGDGLHQSLEAKKN